MPCTGKRHAVHFRCPVDRHGTCFSAHGDHLPPFIPPGGNSRPPTPLVGRGSRQSPERMPVTSPAISHSPLASPVGGKFLPAKLRTTGPFVPCCPLRSIGSASARSGLRLRGARTRFAFIYPLRFARRGCAPFAALRSMLLLRGMRTHVRGKERSSNGRLKHDIFIALFFSFALCLHSASASFRVGNQEEEWLPCPRQFAPLKTRVPRALRSWAAAI